MQKHEIIDRLKIKLNKSRFEHTLRVADVAKDLAETYKCSVNKVELAALMHDYAKCEKTDDLKRIMMENNISIDLLEYNKELWHGPVAAFIAENSFDIKDQDVLHAVRYHTTGRANMSEIEKILFVADYIEPNRTFKEVEEVRAIAKKNLPYAAWLVVRNTIQYLMKKKSVIHPDTFKAYNDLTKQIGVM